MNDKLPQFDREITLVELLRAVPRAKLESALAGIVGKRWQVVDAGGTRICGPGLGDVDAEVDMPVRGDMEVIGRLKVCDASSAQVAAAVALLEIVLAGAYRYLMAASLHLQAVHADYEALQRKHAALQESEARYRELAEQLEQRVKSQVAVIEQAQRHLYQAEKMASVGSLAAGMAHEINNPVGFIRSNLSTAAKYVEILKTAIDTVRRENADAIEPAWHKFDIGGVLEDFPGLLAESADGADRIARIVANLKAYASVDCASETPSNLNDAAHSVARIICDQLPENISLELDLRPLPSTMCDQGRMNQVLFSLVQNARQALGDRGGLIRVASTAADGYIRIAVSDNGCGISDALLSRIFDPFFTTREVGKGMGLGLTVSRDIVQAHGGHMEVTSEVGVGSTFTVCIPVRGGAVDAAAPGGAP